MEAIRQGILKLEFGNQIQYGIRDGHLVLAAMPIFEKNLSDKVKSTLKI